MQLQNVGSISSAWIGLTKHRRMDADFWLKAKQIAAARNVDTADLQAFGSIVRELENRGEFPAGPAPRKAPEHIECPKCLSWGVDSTETVVTKTQNGERTIKRYAVHLCRGCSHAWKDGDQE